MRSNINWKSPVVCALGLATLTGFIGWGAGYVVWAFMNGMESQKYAFVTAGILAYLACWVGFVFRGSEDYHYFKNLLHSTLLALFLTLCGAAYLAAQNGVSAEILLIPLLFFLILTLLFFQIGESMKPREPAPAL